MAVAQPATQIAYQGRWGNTFQTVTTTAVTRLGFGAPLRWIWVSNDGPGGFLYWTLSGEDPAAAGAYLNPGDSFMIDLGANGIKDAKELRMTAGTANVLVRVWWR